MHTHTTIGEAVCSYQSDIIHPSDHTTSMVVGANQVEGILRTKLDAQDVEVVDISGGCGSSFEVYVTSDKFQGKGLLQRHKLVNEALAELLSSSIHALSIKRTKTPSEIQKQQQQQ